MMVTKFERRAGAYYDSVVLMQLQKGLAALPGVADAGVVMATAANKEVLTATGFDLSGITAEADDLLIVVRAADEQTAVEALAQVDPLLKQRQSSGTTAAYRPKSLASAVKGHPAADWVLVSVPGRYAAGVAQEALDHGKHVFLYSDNVSLEDEIKLKEQAAAQGLLLMGPDCGTAIVNGIGLGFANRVRRGHIGVVAASGTGLQAVTVGIHNRGGGISQALGTGGRDLKEAVGGRTAAQAIQLLATDSDTNVIVLISKPPSPAIATKLLRLVQASGKPAVINFIGYPPPGRHIGRLYFATSLDEAADLATQLTNQPTNKPTSQPTNQPIPPTSYLRALFSGGTLAYETMLALQPFLDPLTSNVPLRPEQQMADLWHSNGHCIIDLGEDAFTQGRLHPMMDNDLRLRRLRQEAADPQTGLLLLDVVLGEGAHPDPASELAPAIATIRAERPELPLLCLVIGTADDPQNTELQIEQLQAAGVEVWRTVQEVASAICGRLPVPEPSSNPTPTLSAALSAINVGLESFYDSLQSQGAQAVQVEWRPPAGGNEKMMALLAKLKRSSTS